MTASIFFRLVLFLALLMILDRTAGAQDWTLSGNAGTNPATNFLGTRDNIPLILRTNNAERMRIDAAGVRFRLSTNSNLLVGRATRTDIIVLDDIGIDLTTDLNTTPLARILFDGGASPISTQPPTRLGSLGFFTRGALDSDIVERMRITETGSVGIGTASPGARLQVNNSIRMADDYPLYMERTVGTTSADAFILHNAWYASGDQTLRWATSHASFGLRGVRFNYLSGIHLFADAVATREGETFTPTTRMFIGNNGNVGIGTVDPAAQLEIRGTGTTGPGADDVRITGTGTVGAGIELECNWARGKTPRDRVYGT